MCSTWPSSRYTNEAVTACIVPAGPVDPGAAQQVSGRIEYLSRTRRGACCARLRVSGHLSATGSGSRSVLAPVPSEQRGFYREEHIAPSEGPEKGAIMSANAIKASTERFMAEPSAARSAPAVTASLVDGRARLSAGSFNWDADLPPAVGGENSAPSPTAHLLGALAGCAVVFIHDTLAPQLGLQLDDVSAVARCTADARGLLGMDGAVPDLGDVEVEIHVVSPEPADRLQRLFELWQERCPIYLALAKPVPVQATFTTEAGAA
jgi:uncharacterized OsmC-like protein